MPSQTYRRWATRRSARRPSVTLSFEDAAVLPLGISTAVSALFQADYLAMKAPSAEAARSGQTLLVWSGSTSVGINTVQLAISAGYDVVATASPRDHALLKGLGATVVHTGPERPDGSPGRRLKRANRKACGTAKGGSIELPKRRDAPS
jgi:NADPH:quinone reductase-like Zn-dependent oxidoreductase